MEVFSFSFYVFIVISLSIISFFLYVIFSLLKSMKQRNEYLRDIRDELRIKDSN